MDKFPKSDRATVVRAILAACAEARAKSLEELSPLMLRRGRTYGANMLHYLVDKHLVAACKEGRLMFQPSDRKATRGGYAYSRYSADSFAWIHKKANSPDRLPKVSVFREEHARGNQGTWDFETGDLVFGEEVRRVMVAWGHQDFELTFVVLGVPKTDYSGWAYTENLTGFTGVVDLFAPVPSPTPTTPQDLGYSGLRLIKRSDKS